MIESSGKPGLAPASVCSIRTPMTTPAIAGTRPRSKSESNTPPIDADRDGVADDPAGLDWWYRQHVAEIVAEVKMSFSAVL